MYLADEPDIVLAITSAMSICRARQEVGDVKIVWQIGF